MKKKLLNVRKTSVKEVAKMWEIDCSMIPLKLVMSSEVYVRCNSKGFINWEVAPVYTKDELEKKPNYQIIGL
jgi:hypothetical protein